MDVTVPVYPYQQIAAQIRAKIASGEITGQLPTLLDIMNQTHPRPGYNTVRKAIKMLADEGLVEARPGMGTFVKKEQP